MAKQLLGKEVNETLIATLQARTAALQEKGIKATLGIIRLGENPSDLSYERGATKRAEEVGVAVKKYILPENATAVGIPAQIVRIAGKTTRYVDDVDQTSVRNPTLEKLAALAARVEELEKQLSEK